MIHKRITFKNIDKSDVLEAYANKQLAKVEEFLKNEQTPIYLDLVFEPSKMREHHRVELRVKTPRFDRISEYEFQGEPFYEVVDRVIDTMYRELHEDKRRMVDERKAVSRNDEFKTER